MAAKPRKFRLDDESWGAFCTMTKEPAEKLRELVLAVINGDEGEPLKQIMSVKEAADKWGLESATIEALCQGNKVKSIQIDGVWVIEKHQAPPK